MSFWHIGPIKGEFQPEEFTESQETTMDEQDNFGVQQLRVKGWSAREVTVSFVVDNLSRSASPPPDSASGSPNGTPVPAGDLSPDNSTDPEEVWAAIQQMQRPADSLPVSVPRIPVLIPGWGGAGFSSPRVAFITSASIQRTHIKGNGLGGSQPVRAKRATITLTLKEASEFG